MVDYGNITPEVFSASVSFWNSGASLPPGSYRVRYVNGAMEYAMCSPTQCWSVNTAGGGFHVKHNGGVADVLFPASSTAWPSQPEAEMDNSGKFLDFVHTGGAIGMNLLDSPYSDNVPGSPNPTFNLVLMGCDLGVALIEGTDFILDLELGRIQFLSTGRLGPTVEVFFADGGCAVRIDFDCGGPLHILCPSKINECLPCNDDPVLNISAEDPDSDRFLFNFNLRQRPPLTFRFEQIGCQRWCWSEESQEDADLCAIRQVLECLNDGLFEPPSLIPPFGALQSPALFVNSAQTCTTFCPDGSGFGATLAAGLVVDRNQIQANRIAFSLACRLSRLQRVCILTNSLPTACLDTEYSKRLLGKGGTPFRVTFDNFDALAALCAPATSFPNSTFPYVWSATGLPAGLSVEPCSGRFMGTPSASGSFSVTVRAQDSIGSFQIKPLTLRVVKFVTDSALPDATVGNAYNRILEIDPAGTYIFQFFAGSPPEWLSLDPVTGALTGTPDEVRDFVFTISAEASDGTQCTKMFTLSAKPASLLSYWKMDEASGNRSDSLGINNLTAVILDPPAVAGVIANAVNCLSDGSHDLQKISAAGLWTYQNGITMAGWFKFSGPTLSDLGTNGSCGFGLFGGGGELFRLLAAADGFLYAESKTAIGLISQALFSGVVLGTFMFIRIWIDPADNKIHCKINEGATQHGGNAMTPFNISALLNLFFLKTPLGESTIDEVGIWGGVLTDTQGAFLYNAGAGKTYPDVLNLP